MGISSIFTVTTLPEKEAMEGELTFALIKPNVVEGCKIGAVLEMIEKNDFEILAMQMFCLTTDQAQGFYAEHKDQEFFSRLIDFITSGRVVALVLKKTNAVKSFRSLIGTTNPETADPETIRNLFGETVTRNAIHGSDSNENASVEISYFFPNWNGLC